jgi:hypothetical protein
VEVYTGTFDTTAEAVDDLHWLLGSSFEVLDVDGAIRSTFTVSGLWLCGSLFAIGLVDVSSSQRLGLAFCGGLRTRGAVGGCELLSVCNFGPWTRLERLQSARCVNGDTEMAGERWANV